jgi:transmembrane sensor
MPTTPHKPHSDHAQSPVQNPLARSNPSCWVDQRADEREFESFAQDQDPLDIAAATWVTRRRSGLNGNDEVELQVWLSADPRHNQVFEEMEAIFSELQQQPDDNVAQLRSELVQRKDIGLSKPRSLLGLLSLLYPLMPQAATTAIIFVVLGSGWLGWSQWQRQPVFEQAYATERGQQLKVNLPDNVDQTGAPGSILQLDTATQTQVQLYRDRREVHLRSGQAMFAVRSDPQRPFYVYSDTLRIAVVGTRFSVRHTATGLAAGQTVVEVEEGLVRVEKRHPLADGTKTNYDFAVELRAGQTVVADAHGHIGQVTTLAVNAIAPWRDGRLSFDQTPLSSAIAEFERYGRTGLVVHEPALAAMPVGGSYNLKQWQGFAEALPQVLPVRLVQRGAITEVVAK